MNKNIIKSQASTLITATKRFAKKDLSNSEALEILSNLYQFKDYNGLANWLKPETALNELSTDFQIHALSTLEDEYHNECVITATQGRSIHMPAYPDECDYIRIVDRAGHEIAYWTSTEWEEAPAEVMGAIMGALNGGKRTIPPFPQTTVEKKKPKTDDVKYLKKPLSKKAIKDIINNQEGSLLEVVPMELGDLIDYDIEGLNDMFEELILGEDRPNIKIDGEEVSVHLSDIYYRVAGCIPANANNSGSVLVEVSASLETF